MASFHYSLSYTNYNKQKEKKVSTGTPQASRLSSVSLSAAFPCQENPVDLQGLDMMPGEHP